MKKYVLLFIMILASVFLYGCGTDVDIECGVSADYTAYVDVDMSTDMEDMDEDDRAGIINGYAAYAEDRREYGYKILKRDLGVSDETRCTLNFRYARKCDSYEAAVDALRIMLADEDITPFDEVSVDYSDTDREKGYRIRGRVDAHHVIEDLDIPDFSVGNAGMLAGGLDNSRCTLTLVMPSYKVTDTTGNIEYGAVTAKTVHNILFDAPTEVIMEGMSRLHGGYPSLFGRYNMIGIGAVSVISLAVTALCIVTLVRRKKRSY